ncbi:MAG: hypothetical protein A3D92_00840 [Bacteroidetes bacterium RIFCSPHIGHO2_02_FULL_44_7]|nr:MAG: hypothetical protein A3D92_00840 [Bacteroidetes bacterium RIFCSPHIGHO2_02_FULL_44_7]
MRNLFFLMLITATLLSCKKEEKQAEADEKTIVDYMKDNGLTGTRTSSGVYVVIDNPGTGAACGSTSTVEVAYTGSFTNHEEFDSSPSATFSLNSVIKGWQEGIPYFREGGSGKLLIPSAAGYGTQGKGSIPGNTVLIFDVELTDVL